MLYIVYLNYFTKELPMVKEHKGVIHWKENINC